MSLGCVREKKKEKELLGSITLAVTEMHHDRAPTSLFIYH